MKLCLLYVKDLNFWKVFILEPTFLYISGQILNSKSFNFQIVELERIGSKGSARSSYDLKIVLIKINLCSRSNLAPRTYTHFRLSWSSDPFVPWTASKVKLWILSYLGRCQWPIQKLKKGNDFYILLWNCIFRLEITI